MSKYEDVLRYRIRLDDGEHYGVWSDGGYTTVSGLASDTLHVSGANSVKFNKTGTNDVHGLIRKEVSSEGMDINDVATEGALKFSIYIPDNTDVASIDAHMVSDTTYALTNSVGWSNTTVASGWNSIAFNLIDGVQAGDGADWKNIRHIVIGAVFSNATDTLDGILLDSVKIQIPSTIEISQGSTSFGELDFLRADEVPDVATITVPMKPVDLQGNVITGGGGTSGGLSLYSSPIHFTAAYLSATTLDLSGMSFSITDFSQFVEIEAWDASSAYIAKYTPKSHVFSWDGVNNRVTVTGAAFVSGGTYKVSILAPDRTISLPTDSQKSLILNPVSEEYVFETVADVTNEADASTDYYVALGSARSCVVQFNQSGGTDVLGLSVLGTVQNDAVASSCLYQDITEHGMDWLTVATASGMVYDSAILKMKDGSGFKYVKLTVTKTGGSNDGDYAIYVRKAY